MDLTTESNYTKYEVKFCPQAYWWHVTYDLSNNNIGIWHIVA